MAAFNKVMMIGRLTRDPEVRMFNNGGKVAKFGFAVSNRKKNASGQWEDDPVFIDCEVFNRGDTGKMAETVEKFCKKGSQVFVEGKLQMESWTDKASGQKRSKMKIVVDNFQMLDKVDTSESLQSEDQPKRKGAYKNEEPVDQPSSDDDVPF